MNKTDPYFYIQRLVDEMESEAKHCRLKARLLLNEAEILELKAIRLMNALADQKQADDYSIGLEENR